MGTDGMNMGKRFIATKEAPVMRMLNTFYSPRLN
jgi:NAD(P)H-dependent flavin oxidoreductase YrpB (nitropropane dioxygenase family)